MVHPWLREAASLGTDGTLLDIVMANPLSACPMLYSLKVLSTEINAWRVTDEGNHCRQIIRLMGSGPLLKAVDRKL